MTTLERRLESASRISKTEENPSFPDPFPRRLPIRERLRCAHDMLTNFRSRLMRESVEGGFSGRSDVDRDTIESHRLIEHLDRSLPDVCQTRLV